MTAGNIPVDDNNKPRTSGVQKAHLIYIETGPDTTLPKWDTAWVDGTAFSTSVVRIIQEKVEIGKTKSGEKDVVIQPAEGNILWQIMLNPLQVAHKANEHISKNAVVLSGVWKKRRVNYDIKEETELAPVFGE